MRETFDEVQEAEDDAVERALNELNTLLDHRQPPTAEQLAEWRRSAAVSADIFSCLAFGIIEWDKAIGRPNTVTLASGFEISAGRWDVFTVYTPSGLDFVQLLVPYHVSSWDGRDDDEKWRVYFITNCLPANKKHFVEVRFNSQSGWTPAQKYSAIRGGFRAIEPSIVWFKIEDVVGLPKFEVVLKGFADL